MKNNSIKDNLVLRHLTIEDSEEFNKLLRYAFQITNNVLLEIGWDSDEIKEAKLPILQKAEVIGYFDNKNLISQIALYPMKMNIYGKIYSMCGVTGVATYPEFSGIGLMKSLMKTALSKMRENNQSICCLYPYSIPYYRQRGWEIISDRMTFSLTDSQLPKNIDVSGSIRRVDANHADLLSLHDEFARKTHGCLLRDELCWEEYWRWEVDDVTIAIYYDENSKPTGYIVYLLENDIFKIKEMIYLNTEAKIGLWNYVNAHKSMFLKVKGKNYTNETLAFLLDDGHIKETITPYIMARIVDVKQFLSNFNFDKISNKKSISFIVKDDLLDWNNDIFTLHFDKELVAFDNEKVQNRVILDIQTLTTMLMGYKRPSYLKQIERLSANEESIDLLEDILPEGKVYFSDYF